MLLIHTVHTHACMHTCMHTHTHINTYYTMYTHTYKWACTSLTNQLHDINWGAQDAFKYYVYAHMYMCACVWVCVYTCALPYDHLHSSHSR